MSLTKDERDRAVVAKLKLGFTAVEIKEMCDSTLGLEDFKLSRIYTLKRELTHSKEDELAKDFASVPAEVIEHVVEEARSRVIMDESGGIDKKSALQALTGVIDSKAGLQRLEADFQDTASEALRVFNRHLLDPDLPLKDVKMIMDTIAKAHMDIFSSTTNIHIGDNNSNEQKLSVFQNTMRN